MSSGIITTYLVLRLVVRRGFLDSYPSQAFPPHLQSLVSDYATNQDLRSASEVG